VTDVIERTPVPSWFTEALATAPAIGEIEVDGARIAYRAWAR
jgi:hypothetical protein